MTTTIFRFLFPHHPLLTVTLFLCFFNYILFLVNTNFHKGVCNHEKKLSGLDRHKRSSGDDKAKAVKGSNHWNIQDNNQYWVVEMAKYSTFDWETEIERLFELIPVLETRTDNKTSDDTDQRLPVSPNDPTLWGQNFSKSMPMPLVTEKVEMNYITSEIKRLNSNATLSRHDAKDDLFKGIFGCKEMSKLEGSKAEPRIKYSFRTVSSWKGDFKITAVKSVPVLLKIFVKKNSPPKAAVEKMNYVMLARKNQKPYFDKSFEHAKNNVINLLKMQGWYGIPRLYGVCITSARGTDVTESILNPKNNDQINTPSKIRYIVSRHDDGIPLCDSYYATFECQRLHSITRLVNSQDSPELAALTIMLNTATLFEQFWKNRAVLYNLIGNEVYVDSNLDIILSDTSSVKFMPANEYSEHAHVQRLLSGTICIEHKQCPQASWHANTISYKLGLHCREVRGLCTAQNRCWGIDSHVHACILSKWFFGKLHSLIPSSWTHEEDLTNLLQCASKHAPNERCDWTQLKTTLQQIHESAKEEWDTKPKRKR